MPSTKPFLSQIRPAVVATLNDPHLKEFRLFLLLYFFKMSIIIRKSFREGHDEVFFGFFYSNLVFFCRFILQKQIFVKYLK
jgi:hypothetical protein